MHPCSGSDRVDAAVCQQRQRASVAAADTAGNPSWEDPPPQDADRQVPPWGRFAAAPPTVAWRPCSTTRSTTQLVGTVGAAGAKVAAYLALDVATATSQDPQTLRAPYLGMDLIVRYVIVPLALASLLTGLVMAVGTRWGLVRHYLGADLPAADHRCHGRPAGLNAGHQRLRGHGSSSHHLCCLP